ncbi:MAG: hypothetical protein NC117_07245 [Pseudoflavonifractor sp.]|nr:hypothetical protein [Pseudoflavonifractor sp.]
MNNTIPLPRLIESLAAITGSSESLCDSFLRELFALISDGLAAGNTVRIKYIGCFSPANDGLVSYTPDKEIESAINRPFEFFEPVELSDDVTEDMLANADAPIPTPATSETETETKAEPETETETEAKIESETATETGSESETATGTATGTESKSETVTETAPEAESATEIAEPAVIETPDSPCPPYTPYNNTPSESSEPNDTPQRLIYPAPPERHTHHCSRRRFLAGLAIGLVAGIMSGAGITYLMLNNRQKNAVIIERITHAAGTATIDTIDTIDRPMPDTVSPQPTAKAVADVIPETPATTPAKERLDTIRQDRFLTTMARKYYGEMIFWVYIYEENKDRLSHPDKIRPGTVVRIPDAAKYGIDRDDPQSTAAARAKAVEIYGRYE